MAAETTDTGQYSMRVVTRMTGLAADTIRAWERRYSAVVPQRSEGNTRRFSAEDVRRLTLMREATTRGYRIGAIARLNEEELRGLISARDVRSDAAEAPVEGLDVECAQVTYAKLRERYLEAIKVFDVRIGAELLGRAAAALSPGDLVLEVLLPIMRTTGDLWETGEFTVGHEHLVSFQVRSLLDRIIRFSSPYTGAPKIVAGTPGGHHHEFGALAGALLAALRGIEVVYLGADVPVKDLKTAVELSDADILLLSVVLKSTAHERNKLAKAVAAMGRNIDIWVGISPDHPLTSKLENVEIFHRFEDFDIALTKLLR